MQIIFNLVVSLIFLLGPVKTFSKDFVDVNNLFISDSNKTPIHLKSDKSTFLYCSKAHLGKGDLKIQPGDNMEWRGNAELVWDINVPADDQYEMYLIANVRNDVENVQVSFKTDEAIGNFELKPTKGPYIDGRNFQRIKLSSELVFKKGQQIVSLTTNGVSEVGVLFDIRSIELVPISAKEKIKEEKVRAINSRESFDWVLKSGYGLMFHWTSESVQPDGTIKSYEKAVNDFDVKKFANMVSETGAGYVIFTIGHAESYCPAPIKSWEKRHPGKTTARDLVAEIADALNKNGVKLICYINGPLAFKLNVKGEPTDTEKQDFVTNFKDMLTELGNRYEHKIAGYWYDTWYRIFEDFPDVPFEEFNKVSKIGNESRVICLNSWIYPSVTPWQDYWAGEVNSPIVAPVNGFMKDGPVMGLPYQALITMEPYWVQKKALMPEPKFTALELSEYILTCMKNRGAVTINMAIFQNGAVGEKAFKVMKKVKTKVRKTD